MSEFPSEVWSEVLTFLSVAAQLDARVVCRRIDEGYRYWVVGAYCHTLVSEYQRRLEHRLQLRHRQMEAEEKKPKDRQSSSLSDEKKPEEEPEFISIEIDSSSLPTAFGRNCVGMSLFLHATTHDWQLLHQLLNKCGSAIAFDVCGIDLFSPLVLKQCAAMMCSKQGDTLCSLNNHHQNNSDSAGTSEITESSSLFAPELTHLSLSSHCDLVPEALKLLLPLVPNLKVLHISAGTPDGLPAEAYGRALLAVRGTLEELCIADGSAWAPSEFSEAFIPGLLHAVSGGRLRRLHIKRLAMSTVSGNFLRRLIDCSPLLEEVSLCQVSTISYAQYVCELCANESDRADWVAFVERAFAPNSRLSVLQLLNCGDHILVQDLQDILSRLGQRPPHELVTMQGQSQLKALQLSFLRRVDRQSIIQCQCDFGDFFQRLGVRSVDATGIVSFCSTYVDGPILCTWKPPKPRASFCAVRERIADLVSATTAKESFRSWGSSADGKLLHHPRSPAEQPATKSELRQHEKIFKVKGLNHEEEVARTKLKSQRDFEWLELRRKIRTVIAEPVTEQPAQQLGDSSSAAGAEIADSGRKDQSGSAGHYSDPVEGINAGFVSRSQHEEELAAMRQAADAEVEELQRKLAGLRRQKKEGGVSA